MIIWNQKLKVQMDNRPIVALDFGEADQAMRIVSELSDFVSWFKVGKQLFTSTGPCIVEQLREADKSVFLDLKFHDIPNTVGSAVASATAIGANMINIHASGGIEMMKVANRSAEEVSDRLSIPKPKLLGVTVLTSMDQSTFQKDFSSSRTLSDQVAYLSVCAKEAGLDGVVASPLEIEIIREKCGAQFWIVTPGVRPKAASLGDQKRVMTPKEAIDVGANQIVVGRPITQAIDSFQATKSIFAEINE